jgi:hypothetical protein
MLTTPSPCDVENKGRLSTTVGDRQLGLPNSAIAKGYPNRRIYYDEGLGDCVQFSTLLHRLTGVYYVGAPTDMETLRSSL